MKFRTEEEIRKSIRERYEQENERIVRERLELMNKIENEVREKFKKTDGV